MTRQITLEQIVDFLSETPMFGDLKPRELAEVVHIMTLQTLRPGQFAFREGDVGDAWYVVHDGGVEVLKKTRDGDQMLATLGPRACFGEMAILDGSPRSASVRATQDTLVFRFPRDRFNELLNTGNLSAFKLVHQMALVLVARQRQITTRLAQLLASEKHGEELRDNLHPLISASSVTE